MVFGNGILLLGAISAVVLVAFRGDTTALIPLYAFGVFLAFTLSQAGMVRRWLRLRGPGWKTSALINGVGAVTTGIVVLVQGTVNKPAGAWAVIFATPVGVWILWRIRRHYDAVARGLSMDDYQTVAPSLRHRVVVLVPDVHRGIMRAINVARALGGEVEGLYVNTQPSTAHGVYRRVLKTSTEPHLEVVSEAADRLRARWQKWVPGVPLTVLDSEYRSVTEPILEHIDELLERGEADIVTVVVAETVPRRWWEQMLHNQSGLMLKLALANRPDVMVCNVRYFLGEP